MKDGDNGNYMVSGYWDVGVPFLSSLNEETPKCNIRITICLHIHIHVLGSIVFKVYGLLLLLTHSFSHSLTRSLIHTLILSLTHSFTHSHTHSLTHSLHTATRQQYLTVAADLVMQIVNEPVRFKR